MTHRNAFGTLLSDPATLDRSERVDELRKVCGRLQAAPDRGSRWLGAAVLGWLHQGGDLYDLLDLRPPRGSRLTVSRLLRQERQDAALLRLATAVGCDRLALAMLRNKIECPDEHLQLLDAALGLRAPTGPHAISRARRRDRQRGMK